MQVQRQHDPTLPPPWEALFDPASGLKYYWNPQTNVTQYERPLGGPAPPPLAAPSGYVRATSSAQIIAAARTGWPTSLLQCRVKSCISL